MQVRDTRELFEIKRSRDSNVFTRHYYRARVVTTKLTIRETNAALATISMDLAAKRGMYSEFYISVVPFALP